MNLDWPYGSCYTSFFTDLMKQTSGFNLPAGAARDSNGWPINVSGGSSILMFIWSGLALPGAAFRPGTYKARMDAAHAAAGWTCQFVDARSSGIAAVGPRAATATVTVTNLGADGDYSGLTLNLNVYAPPSGGPYNLSGLQIFKQEHEAWLDSGTYYSIFDPDFLADMTGVKCIRVKDWLGTDISALNYDQGSSQFIRNKSGPCSVADLPSEASRTWQMPSSAQFAYWQGARTAWGGQVPYSVCAKLARYLNCTLMMTFPLMHDMVSYDAFASTDIFRAYGHGYQDGDVIVLRSTVPTASGGLSPWTKYYARDVVAGVSFKLARTLGGAAIDITADSIISDQYTQLAYKLYSESDTQTFYNAIAAQMFAVAPGIDIISDVGNENWNVPQPYGWDQCAYCLTNQTSNRNAGSGYAWALMRAWKAIETYYPREQHIRQFSGQQAFFAGLCTDGYNYIDATLYSGAKLANLIDAHCNAPYITGSFKTGANNAGLDAIGVSFPVNPLAVQGSDWYSVEAYVPGDVVHMTDGKNYTCTLAHTNHAPPNATYWTLSSTDSITGVGATWTNDQMLAFGLRSNANIAYYSALYKQQGDALRSNTIPAAYITYEGGPIWGNCPGGGPGGDLTFVRDKMAPFMKTAQFRTYMQDFVTTVLRGTGITVHNEYIGAGQWRWVTNTDALVFGLKRAHHLPDTLAYAYYKTASL